MRGTRGIIEIGHHNRMTVSNTAFHRDIQQSREAKAVLFHVFSARKIFELMLPGAKNVLCATNFNRCRIPYVR